MPPSSVTLAVAVGLPLVQSFGIGMPQSLPMAPVAVAFGRTSAPMMIAELLKPNAKSSMPALGNVLPDCPSTKWNADGLSAVDWQKKYKAEGDLPVCPVEVVATTKDNAMGVEYFVQNRAEIQASTS